MKAMNNPSFQQMLATVPTEVQQKVDFDLAISNRIYELMAERGLTQKQLAKALGKRPGEITKWLSGQHNFTIKTLNLLSLFFNKTLVSIM